MVEPIISLWKINKLGQLYQINEHSFEYFQDFHPTKNGKMKLSLSYDRKLVSLNLVNSKKDNQIQVQAWYASNLKKFDVNLSNLNKALMEAPTGGGQSLLELSFINGNKTVLL